MCTYYIINFHENYSAKKITNIQEKPTQNVIQKMKYSEMYFKYELY